MWVLEEGITSKVFCFTRIVLNPKDLPPDICLCHIPGVCAISPYYFPSFRLQDGEYDLRPAVKPEIFGSLKDAS